MDRETFYRLLYRDPYRAHAAIRESGAWDELLRFCKFMAMKHKLCLAILPVKENDITKWKLIAKMYLGELVDNRDEAPICITKDAQGLWEMCTHFRRAGIMRIKKSGKEVVRSGAIIRADRLDPNSFRVLSGIKAQYNKAMKERVEKDGMEFIPLVEWVKERPYLYENWMRCISLRKPTMEVASV